uniref:SFRICE_006527 n=1 Tax=Spodoptera frugiperda TaxID=7108 RepID=A0A2H1VMZ7_SPOFR
MIVEIQESRLKIVQGGDVSGSTHSACGARGARGVSAGRAGYTRARGAGGGRSGVAPLQPVQALRTTATHYVDGYAVAPGA